MSEFAWGGVFGGTRSTDPSRPDVLTAPPSNVTMPDEDDLEVWAGQGSLYQAWSWGGQRYVTIHFNHSGTCTPWEVVPSDNVGYVYLYDDVDDVDE